MSGIKLSVVTSILRNECRTTENVNCTAQANNTMLFPNAIILTVESSVNVELLNALQKKKTVVRAHSPREGQSVERKRHGPKKLN